MVATAVTDKTTPATQADADLQKAVRRFEEAEHVTRPARLLSERDRDYYDGKQWTPTEEKLLKDRKQPVVTYNRILRKVNYLQGLERQTRKDPRAFPRTPNDEQAAQAATDAIRYICDQARWDEKRSEAFGNLTVEGIGVIEVGVSEGKDGLDPELRWVPWDRFYYDPYSSRWDFSDAGFMGVVVWMDLDEALTKYPDAEAALTETWKSGRDADTYDDRPKDNLWSDYGRRRIRICQEYCKKGGVWYHSVFTFGGFIVEPQESPYQDSDGKPECPLVAVSMYVDRDNNRYGEVRVMISPQDEVNKRRSKALHLMNMRQVRVGRGLEQNVRSIKKELASPDGAVVADADELEILNTTDMAAANLSMLQEAKAEIDLLGPNAALQGKNEQDMSGRAILAQQQGGMVEVAVLLDRVRSMSLAVYRKVWARVRQYWTEERWVRITDDQRNLKFVGLNRPVTAAEALQEQMQANQWQPRDEQEAAMLQAFLASPQAQQIVRIDNQVGALDIDIVIDEGLDTPTVQAEQFDALVKALPAILQTQAQAPNLLEVLIEASSLRDKDKLLEKLRGGQQGGPSPEEMMQAQQQAVMAEAQMQGQIEIEKAKIGAAAKVESAQIAAQADLIIAGQKGELEVQALTLDHDRKREVEARKWEADARAKDEAEAKVAVEPGPEGASLKALAEALANLAAAQVEAARPKRRIPVYDENGMIAEMREEPLDG
jgi:hypothetical protein